jgi:hypothetical protein
LSNSLAIYAEYLRLELQNGQTISSPGNDLHFYAAAISVANSSSIAVDISGNAGSQGVIASGGNASPTTGSNGTQGGNFVLYAENIDSDSASTLQVLARGGSGGRGQSAPAGIPAPGGSGEGGGQVDVLVGTFMGYLVDQFMGLFAGPPPPAAPSTYTYGGVPGPAFLNSVSAFLTPYTTFNPTSTTASKPVGYDEIAQTPRLLDRMRSLNTYISTLASKPPATANDSQLDTQLVAFQMHLKSIAQTFALTLLSHISVLGGFPGGGGTGLTFDLDANRQQQLSGTYVKAGSGMPGSAGHASAGVRYNSSKACLGRSNLLPAHPDQCNMLLAQAKNAYFLKQGSVASALLQKLQSRLSFLGWITPTDPMYQAYAANQSLLHMDTLAQVAIPPGSSFGSTTPSPSTLGIASLDTLQDIRRSTILLNNRMKTGLDYFGHQFGWVPRASYTSYIDLCHTLLTNLANLEQAYTAYTAADATQAAMQQAFVASWNSSSSAINVAKAKIADLDVDLSSTANTLSLLRPQVVAAKATLDNLWAKAKETVKQSFSDSMSKIINVAGMCAMAPESPMPLVGALDLYNTAENDVTDDNDTTVSKDYLVGRIEQVQATEDALDEGYTQRQDGSLVPDDPRATKLIASENDMMALLSKYSNLLGSNNLNDIKDAYDSYIGECLLNRSPFLNPRTRAAATDRGARNRYPSK